MRSALYGAAGVAALAIALGAALHFGWFADAVWRFNFAPQVAPDFEDFAKVTGATRYQPERGYGWVDLEGELRVGTYQNSTPGWESTRNLNLVLRAGPDELACSFATGRATFALDLDAGSYDVWVLTGDWGALEYVPYEPYTIEVEGLPIEFPGLSEGEFYRRFEDPGPDDTTSDDRVYARHVEPRFRWKKVTVLVSDGQLSVRVTGPQRDPSVLATIGYYVWSDAKYGPKPGFAGALNALVVTRADATSERHVEQIEVLRRERFRAERPRVDELPPGGEPSATELERGYNLFLPSTLDRIFPQTARPHEIETIAVRATPGEYVPISVALQPHRALGTTRVRVDGLPFPVEVGVVRYAISNVGRPPRDQSLVARAWRKYFGERKKPARWKLLSGPIVPADRWEIPAGVTKQFWLTLHVPGQARAGTYAGTIEVQPDSGQPSEVPIELEVLPFSLRRPTHLAVGATYFVPVAYSYFGGERFWARVRADFDDMRRHNMTTVQLTGMGLENYDGLDRLFETYRDAGFEQPIYLLEAFAAIEWLADQYGLPEESEEFYAKYRDIFRELAAEAKRRNWPPLILNFGDEFTNSAREEFGAELARRLKQIPDIVTGADANGYKEVRLLAPHVSIVAFNRGWDGPHSVNAGRRLLNAATIDLIHGAGATPWLVNVDKGRFSNGFYFWKMSRLGIRGKIEWTYRNYMAAPHNPFDGFGRRSGPMVYPGPGTVLATIPYERMRQGLDDLAYLHTLETHAAEAPAGAPRKRALDLLDRIEAMVDDDYETYRGPDAVRWPIERYRRLRKGMIDAILQLQREPE